MGESNKELYEVGEEEGSVGYVKRFQAVVKATDTKVYFHQLEFNPDRVDEDDLLGKIIGFSGFRDPRVTSFIDAWHHDNIVEFVTLEQEGVGLNTDQGRQIFKNKQKDFGFEIAYQSLAGLAVMHQANATHRDVKKECFIIHETGMVFLKDTGILKQLNDFLDPEVFDINEGTQFMLASNLSGFDVADWACMIASIVLGKSLLDPSLRMPNDEIQPEQVGVAQSQLMEEMGTNPFSLFLKKCMQSRADNVGGFDNAKEAIAKFPIEEMKS